MSEEISLNAGFVDASIVRELDRCAEEHRRSRARQVLVFVEDGLARWREEKEQDKQRKKAA